MVNILGIKLSNLSLSEAVLAVDSSLETGQTYAVTPNPEIILAAQKDEKPSN